MNFTLTSHEHQSIPLHTKLTHHITQSNTRIYSGNHIKRALTGVEDARVPVLSVTWVAPAHPLTLVAVRVCRAALASGIYTWWPHCDYRMGKWVTHLVYFQIGIHIGLHIITHEDCWMAKRITVIMQSPLLKSHACSSVCNLCKNDIYIGSRIGCFGLVSWSIVKVKTVHAEQIGIINLKDY